MKWLRTQLNIAAIAALAGALALAAPAGARDEVSVSREVKNFSKILIKGALDLDVEAGKNQSVNITTDSSHVERVTTKVKGDTLVIAMTGRRWRNADVAVEITMRAMEGLIIEGAADVRLKNIDSKEFMVAVDGAGDIFIEGKCGTANFEINGAGDLEAEGFECENVSIEINGAGDAEVYASKSIEASINGVGDIEVYGSPERVRPRIRGLGDFELK